MLIHKRKLDDLFSTPQYLLDGFFRSFALDTCSNNGKILLYVSNLINHKIALILIVLIEINIGMMEWYIAYRAYRYCKSALTILS